jgi:hypothetical protein
LAGEDCCEVLCRGEGGGECCQEEIVGTHVSGGSRLAFAEEWLYRSATCLCCWMIRVPYHLGTCTFYILLRHILSEHLAHPGMFHLI